MSRLWQKQSVVMLGLTFSLALGAQAHDGMADTKQVCAGFVVLPNGYAVLSAMPVEMEQGMHAAQHTPATAESQKSNHQASSMSAQGHAMSHQEHGQHAMNPQSAKAMPAEKTSTDLLLGHHHGEDIVPQEGMTCVPIGAAENNAWTTVSTEPNLAILAKSLKGSLAHNSRANEAMALEIVLDGKVIEQAQVRLLARMPHHDHRMPGGHGPANDPDVQGLEAKYDATQGRYVVPTVDFSMNGPWLFEVQIMQDNTMHKAYFASEIGEE